jgi:hypothetical protein
MANKNEIDGLEEWREHQLNPGYWVNKIPPFLPKRTKGFWILSLIDFFLIIPAFLFSLWMYLSEGSQVYVPLLWILGIGSVVVTLRTINLKPEPPKGKTQIEIEEENRQRKKELKKLPKVRKDYS